MESGSLNIRNEYRALGKLGLPVLVTQVGIIVVSFADTMMVGRYGLNELAAAAFVNNFFMVPVVMQIGFASGITPLAGALFGLGKRKDVGKMLRAGTQINTIVSVCFTAVMAILFFFLHLFGQPEELLPYIRPYYLTMLASLIPLAIFNCFQQVSNGCTDTATPMWIILCANILNIAGNYLLIFGKAGFPEMGLLGAGVSTLVARTLSVVAIIAIYAKSKKRKDYWEGFRHATHLHADRKKVWLTSYPVMIQNGVECCLWTVGAVVSGWHGKIQLASYQVVNTIAQLGFMIYLSVGVATSVRVANFTGKKQWQNVRHTAKVGLHMNLVLGTLASLVFIFAGRPLIAMFTEDMEVITASIALIPPLILYQYGDAIQLTYANALRGTSEVRPLLAVACISYLCIGFPLLFILSQTAGWGNVGVYYSFSGVLISASVLLFVFFRRAVSRLENQH